MRWLLIAAALSLSHGFAPPQSGVARSVRPATRRAAGVSAVVTDVGSAEEFEKALKTAGDQVRAPWCTAPRARSPRQPARAAQSSHTARCLSSCYLPIYHAPLLPQLVVVDYSTSWCGPCKIIAPKFDEFSEQYKKVAFLKVMGDSSPAADKLMRSQGVRALPSFHFWKGGEQVDTISGAKTQALIDAIEQHM
jgi:thioredoxin 1